jgi:hypothetical protein
VAYLLEHLASIVDWQLLLAGLAIHIRVELTHAGVYRACRHTCHALVSDAYIRVEPWS